MARSFPSTACRQRLSRQDDCPARTSPAGRGARITAYLSTLQDSEDRIDIVRDVWVEQMEDTERLLDAFAEASPALAGEWAVA